MIYAKFKAKYARLAMTALNSCKSDANSNAKNAGSALNSTQNVRLALKAFNLRNIYAKTCKIYSKFKAKYVRLALNASNLCTIYATFKVNYVTSTLSSTPNI